jgi:hypothetical protein
MKKIINSSNKKLVFPKYDLALDANEIKEVSNTLANDLLCNSCIREVFSEKQRVELVPNTKEEKKTKIIKKK